MNTRNFRDYISQRLAGLEPGILESVMAGIGPRETWHLGTPARLETLIHQHTALVG